MISVTWETCTLRTWLNNDFYNAAFDDTEKSIIAETTLKNAGNGNYNVPGGNDTVDKVFLLSFDDAVNTEYGFSGVFNQADEARCCPTTEYAKEQGCTYRDDPGGSYCWWWLRTPGAVNNRAVYVNFGGYVDYGGNYANNTFSGVRPAVWIEI